MTPAPTRLASRLLALAFAAALLPGCSRGGSAPPPAPTPGPSPSPAAPRGGASVESQLELSREVLAFQVTDKVVDGIKAAEAELKDFWADPEQAKRIRGQLTLADILAGVESTPRVKQTIERHGLTPREYVLGTFAMLGTYAYEAARKADPKRVEGRKPPVNEESLAVLRRRFPDVETVVLVPAAAPPGAGAAPPATAR